MKQLTRLTIPMEKETRALLTKRAEALGFDSAQALIRYMNKAVIDGRDVTFGIKDDWGEPSPEAVERLNRWAKEAEAEHRAGKLKAYSDVDEFMKDLIRDAKKLRRA